MDTRPAPVRRDGRGAALENAPPVRAERRNRRGIKLRMIAVGRALGAHLETAPIERNAGDLVTTAGDNEVAQISEGTPGVPAAEWKWQVCSCRYNSTHTIYAYAFTAVPAVTRILR